MTRIRSQLALLVLAALAPVAIFAAITTVQLWQLQRQAFEANFLDRVSALRIALDTELEGTIRTLRSLADSADFDRDAAALQAHAHFERLISNGPAWITMGLVDASGTTLVRDDDQGAPKDLALDAATIAAVTANRQPAISNLVSFDDGRVLVTFVAVPVLRMDRFEGIVYVGIEHRRWLEFLKRHPVAEGATLTLNDRDGFIITRTLNDEQWAGKRSLASYWDKTVGRDEGGFRNVGLEGQSFYIAFSRSQLAGWLLGTGVPADVVEAGLAVPTTLLALGIVTAGGFALLLAYLFGRRVADAVSSLAAYAKSMGGPHRPGDSTPLPIAEAETIRVALDEARVELDARERSISEALEREARSRAAAEHANQAKDQFLAMLGHELRNPLSAMSAAAAVQQMAGADEEARSRARDIVQRQLRHLTDIVNDLLDVSRLTIGKIVLNRRPLDLAVVVSHVVASFRDADRFKSCALRTALSPAIVSADETRIEQIVGNLLDNACKYTQGDGAIDISVERVGDEAVLKVVDNGSGIASDLLPHVFDLFAQGARTIDRAQGGLGLGLTVVRRLVELHGGSVAAESGGTNRGSAFIVRLPTTNASGIEDVASAAPVAIPPRRIVVVEDNADSRDVVSALLRTKGHDVTTASDGPTGVEAIDAIGGGVALVDIGLPGFDGIELARRVRQRSESDVILVALTGYGTPEDREKALAAGFDAFLVKPFDLPAFEAVVTDVERLRLSGARK